MPIPRWEKKDNDDSVRVDDLDMSCHALIAASAVSLDA